MDVKQVIERILISYGVRNRQAYSEITKVPLSTISNWVKSGKVPGDYLIQCTLDTGADLKWLMEGVELTNVRFEPGNYPMQGIRLMEAMQSSGGKEILQRIMQAYGFTMQKELGDHLDIPSGTMSAWVRRDHFPGDVVIVCALDTGASLYWLATGVGSMNEQQVQAQREPLSSLPAGLKQITKYSVHSGQLINAGSWFCDESLIPATITDAAFVEGSKTSWVIDRGAKTFSNGLWFVAIDGAIDLCDITRLPGNRLSIKTGSTKYECDVSDVEPVGAVFITVNQFY